MGAFEVRPETPEERVIFLAIVGTWLIWLVGGLYVAGPLIGYGLLGLVIARYTGMTGAELADAPRFHVGVFLWVAGMGAMLVALIVAHLEFELGAAQLLKSSIGWMKGWSLMAVFVVAGAALSVRPAVIFRATGILAAQTLVLVPVFVFAGLVGLPEKLYVSPLSLVGGPGPEFFDVSLYTIDDTTGGLRWRFFAPWSTAAAFLAGLGFVFALYERNFFWKAVGIVAALIMCVMTGSRLSVVAVPAIVVAVLVVSNIRRPMVLIAAAIVIAVGVLVADTVVMAYQDFTDAFYSARAASSRVRAALANIAYHRWQSEAVLFGHGIVERGPHLVQFMPIGTHHTWAGLLFVKGAVGFAGFAIPLAWSAIELAIKAQADRVARAGLGVVLATALFSFGDNMEIVAYLIWPGLLVVGIALGRRLRNPYTGFLGSMERVEYSAVPEVCAARAAAPV